MAPSKKLDAGAASNGARKDAKKKKAKKAKIEDTIAIDTTGNDDDAKVGKYKSDKEKLIEHGVNYISPKTKQKILTKIEFTVKKDTKAYPIQVKLIVLLKLLQAADPELKAISSDKSKTWTDFT
eukprot:11270247-Ditylum_brightwellii.AAC.1